jgi:hypothetical protein
MTDQPNPDIPAHPAAFQFRLKHLADRLAGTGPIKIVALGSSSTAGRGDVIPYPYRLEVILRGKYQPIINVINRGRGGEEAPDEAKRIASDVLAENPAVVIWQIGTTAAWQRRDPSTIQAALEDGLGQLAGRAMDVVLMDPQFVPALVRPPMMLQAAEQMVRLIADVAAKARLNVFQRFALMRAWHEGEGVSFDTLVDMTDPDRLHQSDWSTQRVAIALSEAIRDGLALPA